MHLSHANHCFASCIQSLVTEQQSSDTLNLPTLPSHGPSPTQAEPALGQKKGWSRKKKTSGPGPSARPESPGIGRLQKRPPWSLSNANYRLRLVTGSLIVIIISVIITCATSFHPQRGSACLSHIFAHVLQTPEVVLQNSQQHELLKQGTQQHHQFNPPSSSASSSPIRNPTSHRPSRSTLRIPPLNSNTSRRKEKPRPPSSCLSIRYTCTPNLDDTHPPDP
jgi:hypothetical protein